MFLHQWNNVPGGGSFLPTNRIGCFCVCLQARYWLHCLFHSVQVAPNNYFFSPKKLKIDGMWEIFMERSRFWSSTARSPGWMFFHTPLPAFPCICTPVPCFEKAFRVVVSGPQTWSSAGDLLWPRTGDVKGALFHFQRKPIHFSWVWRRESITVAWHPAPCV